VFSDWIIDLLLPGICYSAGLRVHYKAWSPVLQEIDVSRQAPEAVPGIHKFLK